MRIRQAKGHRHRTVPRAGPGYSSARIATGTTIGLSADRKSAMAADASSGERWPASSASCRPPSMTDCVDVWAWVLASLFMCRTVRGAVQRRATARCVSIASQVPGDRLGSSGECGEGWIEVAGPGGWALPGDRSVSLGNCRACGNGGRGAGAFGGRPVAPARRAPGDRLLSVRRAEAMPAGVRRASGMVPCLRRSLHINAVSCSGEVSVLPSGAAGGLVDVSQPGVALNDAREPRLEELQVLPGRL